MWQNLSSVSWLSRYFNWQPLEFTKSSNITKLGSSWYGERITCSSFRYEWVLRIISCVLMWFRWVLFPTETPKDLLKVRSELGGKHRDEAITWFKYIYPRTQRSDWPKQYAPVSMLLQHMQKTAFRPVLSKVIKIKTAFYHVMVMYVLNVFRCILDTSRKAYFWLTEKPAVIDIFVKIWPRIHALVNSCNSAQIYPI